MKILELKAEKRTVKRSKAVRKLRETGYIPAVVYGHKEDNVILSVNGAEFDRVLNAGVRMIHLTYDNTKESVLIKDVQYDNLSDSVLHVDFSRVSLDERVTLKVPIILTGNSVGVKEGGVLTQAMKSIEIESLPTAVPEDIKVNVSDLEIGKSIHVKELPVMENIKYLSDADAVVVSVHHAAEEKIVSEEELLAGPEVISKKPKEEAGVSEES
ncbi:MAG: 50S ribosomal protein L25 [Candidatus Kuenenia sp.]|nr:50S ribosomal protein L25 [Candidatus Kuenenia hertensis]